MDLYSFEEKRKNGFLTILTYLLIYLIITSFIYLGFQALLGNVAGYSSAKIAEMAAMYEKDGPQVMIEAGYKEFVDFFIRVETITMAVSYLLTLGFLYIILRKEIFYDMKKQYSNRSIWFYYGVYVGIFIGGVMVLGMLVTALENAVIYNDHIFHAKEYLERGSVNQESIELMLKSQMGLVLILTAGIVGPIVEELVYRKGIFNIFKNKWIAFAVSSFCFGMIHVISSILEGFNLTAIVLTALPYIGSGCLFGFIYIKSGENVIVTTAIHITYNLLSMLMILSVPEEPVNTVIFHLLRIVQGI